MVNGQPANTLIDSGSSASFINTTLCHKLGEGYESKPSSISLESTAHSAQVHGTAEVDV